jgi:hypothetical protein
VHLTSWSRSLWKLEQKFSEKIDWETRTGSLATYVSQSNPNAFLLSGLCQARTRAVQKVTDRCGRAEATGRVSPQNTKSGRNWTTLDLRHRNRTLRSNHSMGVVEFSFILLHLIQNPCKIPEFLQSIISYKCNSNLFLFKNIHADYIICSLPQMLLCSEQIEEDETVQPCTRWLDGQMRHAYNIFVGKPERRKPVERSGCRRTTLEWC